MEMNATAIRLLPTVIRIQIYIKNKSKAIILNSQKQLNNFY